MLRDRDGAMLSFAGYRSAAENAAAGLLDSGVAPGGRVAWQLPTTVAAAVLIAALARLGVVQVPVIPILRREVAFMVDQARATTLVVPATWRGFDHARLGAEVAGSTGCGLIVVGAGTDPDDLPSADPAGLPAPPPAPLRGTGPERWVYYTSGTTADPKGVRHSDASAMAASNGMVLVGGLGDDDVVYVPIPITHIGGVMILATVLRTGCSALLDPAFDPQRSPRLAADMGVTVLAAAGPMYGAYLSAQQEQAPEPLLPRLRMCCNGGAPLPAGLHQKVKATLGGIGITSSWGLTEAPALTFPPLDASDTDLDTTVGVPVPGVELRVVGPDGPVPDGDEGELRVRAPQSFLGYVDAALDAAAFDADGFLRTGDLGTRRPDGMVRITGRSKDIIIRNAENISAREVEDVLSGHPAVAGVAVIGLPDPRTGERCCAVVELAPGEGLTLAEVAAHCRRVGMATQKIPEQLEVIEKLPRNDLGKLQKALLRKRYST